MFCAVLLALLGSALAGSIDFEKDLALNVDIVGLQKDLAALDGALKNTADVQAEIALLKAAYSKSVIESPAPLKGSTINDEDANELNEMAGAENIMHIILSHTFGFFHVLSRFDRDKYVNIDFDNIIKNDTHNFALENANKTVLRDIPYEFGSNMHYYHKDFALDESKPAIFAKPAYKIYQEGMMGRLPTFYDILGVNKHFNCGANCKTSMACANGGVQDVNSCSKCLCPSGWMGDKCDKRPTITKTLNATVTIEKIRVDLKAENVTTEYRIEYYLIQAPAGMKVQMTPKVLGGSWSNSCGPTGLEVKFLKDARPSGLQVCDWRVQQPTITSESNEMLVLAYTLGKQFAAEMKYNAVN